MVSVRKAELNDVTALVYLGVTFHSSAKLEEAYPFDPAHLAQTLRRMIRAPNACVLVACDGAKVIGTAGFVTVTTFFTKVVSAYEHFWWVSPEYRGFKNGQTLLVALEEEAKKMGCSVMQMIALHALSPERVGAFYEANGYVPQEHIYMKRL